MYNDTIISAIYNYLEEKFGYFREQLEYELENKTLMISFSGSRLATKEGHPGDYLTPPDPDKIECDITIKSIKAYNDDGEVAIDYDRAGIERKINKLLSNQ